MVGKLRITCGFEQKCVSLDTINGWWRLKIIGLYMTVADTNSVIYGNAEVAGSFPHVMSGSWITGIIEYVNAHWIIEDCRRGDRIHVGTCVRLQTM